MSARGTSGRWQRGLCFAVGGLSACTGGCPPTAGVDGECDSPGVICTVAGTGQSVFDGDGMPALETSFYSPLDVVFDPQGRLRTYPRRHASWLWLWRQASTSRTRYHDLRVRIVWMRAERGSQVVSALRRASIRSR